jgi:hypothetical protein
MGVLSREKSEFLLSKIAEYRIKLRQLDDWDAFLLQESGLPGPRGNLELAHAVADEGDAALFERYLTFDALLAPVNSPYEFLAFCGVLGLGRLLAEGQASYLKTIRQCAADRRWRMREGVAMALQRLGDANIDMLIEEMRHWSAGTLLEQRAAAAVLCEPRLLRHPEHARSTLELLDRITTSILHNQERKSEDFILLRKGLGYCWSVAVAAIPVEGKKSMEKWLVYPDKDIRWIMQENLKKNRLVRMDSDWVNKWKST